MIVPLQELDKYTQLLVDAENIIIGLYKESLVIGMSEEQCQALLRHLGTLRIMRHEVDELLIGQRLDADWQE